MRSIPFALMSAQRTRVNLDRHERKAATMPKITKRFTRWFPSDPLVVGFSAAAGWVMVSVALASPLMGGEEPLTLKGHFGGVVGVAFSADRKRLASANGNRTVSVWNATSGQETLTLKGHTLCVQSATFSSDGKRLASCSLDQTAKVWDATSGQEMLTLMGHTSEVRSVAFSPDGKRLASASDDGTVKVWDVTPRP